MGRMDDNSNKLTEAFLNTPLNLAIKQEKHVKKVTLDIPPKMMNLHKMKRHLSHATQKQISNNNNNVTEEDTEPQHPSNAGNE